MAKLPPKKSEDSTGDWLNTYADMVTLLLTFFVLLFACSNLDDTKLQFIYQAFQSRGKFVNRVVDNQDTNTNSGGGTTDTTNKNGGDGEMPQSFDELYVYLADYIENNSLANLVSVEQGAAHITVRFKSSVFFDGDSHILKEEGKQVLNGMIPGFKAIRESIKTATVAGHTSAGNSSANDWTLSSLRAVSVVNYLDDNDTIDFMKYRVKGCGPTEPISDVQAENRRVEIMILKNDLDLTDPAVIKDILEHDYGLGSDIFDPDNNETNDNQNLPEGSVDKIIDFIDSKYSDDEVTQVGIMGPGAVDGSMFIAQTEDEGGSDEAPAENADDGAEANASE